MWATPPSLLTTKTASGCCSWPRAWGGTNFSNCITPCIRKYTAADVVAGAFAPVSEAYLTGPDAECPRAWRVAPGGALLLAWSSTLQ